MKLISLKRKPKKTKESVITAPEVAENSPIYPYGTQLSLEKEEMGKLGLSVKGLDIGQAVTMQGRGVVTSLSQSEESQRAEIQLTDIAVSTGKSAKFAEYEKMQKARPGD